METRQFNFTIKEEGFRHIDEYLHRNSFKAWLDNLDKDKNPKTLNYFNLNCEPFIFVRIERTPGLPDYRDGYDPSKNVNGKLFVATEDSQTIPLLHILLDGEETNKYNLKLTEVLRNYRQH